MNKLFAPCFALLQNRWTYVTLLGMLLVATLVATGAFSPSKAYAASRVAFDCYEPCRNSSQLVFIDFIGNTYSIRISGPNQYDTGTTYFCLSTPGRKTTLYNWWWATRTYVTRFSTGNCADGTSIGTDLWFDSDNAYYRCLLNRAPDYSDYDSMDGNCGTIYG